MRRSHLLRENKGGRLPQLLVAFDTETDSVPIADRAVEARLRFGWCAVTRRHRGLRWTPPLWTRFTTSEDFWAVVDRTATAHRRVYVVAHNVGFDFRVTDGFAHLQRLGWTLRGSVIEDPPTILRYRRGRESIVVIDTLNWYRSSLAAIGAIFGLPKGTMPAPGDPSEVWDAYCRRDVEIVLAAMQDTVARVAGYDLGNFAPTISGQAFAAFRHRHLTVPVLLDDNPTALVLARDGYYGGRTEAFRLGVVPGPVTVLDVHSMYPAVMRDTPMPTVLRGMYTRVRVAELPDLLERYACVADVTLETEGADYPLVHDGRLVFPVGTFRTVLPAPELAHAVAAGRVRRVHRLARYDAAILFRSYIDEWWGRRAAALAAGDATGAEFHKRMMNHLYGKFGQRGEVYEPRGPAAPDEVGTWLEVNAQTHVIHRYRAVGGLLSELVAETEGRESHPAIAATVTSAGRMLLLRLLEAAGRRHVVYVDTDSLFVLSGALGPSLGRWEGPGLGQLGRERVVRELVIYGLKDYVADGARKLKGVRRSAVRRGDGVYEQDTFVGLKGAVADHDVGRQVIRRTLKHYRRSYDKGTVDERGYVHPYRLG